MVRMCEGEINRLTGRAWLGLITIKEKSNGRTKRKRGDKSFKCGKRADKRGLAIGECIAAVK